VGYTRSDKVPDFYCDRAGNLEALCLFDYLGAEVVVVALLAGKLGDFYSWLD